MSFMLEEIEQQPAVLEKTYEQEIAHAGQLRERMARNPPSLIVMVARGTSDNAALFGRYLLEVVGGIPVSLAAACACQHGGEPS